MPKQSLFKNKRSEYSTGKKTGSEIKKGLSNKELTELYSKASNSEDFENLFGNRGDSFRKNRVSYPSFIDSGDRQGIRRYSEFGPYQFVDQYSRQYVIEEHPKNSTDSGTLRYRKPIKLTKANHCGNSDNFVGDPSPDEGVLILKPKDKKQPPVSIKIEANLKPLHLQRAACGKATFRLAQ